MRHPWQPWASSADKPSYGTCALVCGCDVRLSEVDVPLGHGEAGVPKEPLKAECVTSPAEVAQGEGVPQIIRAHRNPEGPAVPVETLRAHAASVVHRTPCRAPARKRPTCPGAAPAGA